MYFCDIQNFGDQLNRDIAKYYKLDVDFSSMQHEASVQGPGIFALGSILDRASDFFRGWIVGSGFMDADSRKAFYHADVHAVRGRFTAERILTHSRLPLFDPGVLISKIFPASEKRFKLGIVPHYADRNNQQIQSLLKRHHESILMINVQNSPSVVAHQISSCEHIVSSSLHGLVTAHSYGIPCAWLKLSDKVSGDGFKFHDYMSAYNHSIESFSGTISLESLLQACLPPPKTANDKIELADSVFSRLADLNKQQDFNISQGSCGRYWFRRIKRKAALHIRSINYSYSL